MASSTKAIRPSPVTSRLVDLQPSPWLWQGLQCYTKCSQMSWPIPTPCISLQMSQLVVKSHQSTFCCKCLAEWDNLQCSGMDETLLWKWIGQKLESVLWSNHPTCSTVPPPHICYIPYPITLTRLY